MVEKGKIITIKGRFKDRKGSIKGNKRDGKSTGKEKEGKKWTDGSMSILFLQFHIILDESLDRAEEEGVK